MADYSPILRDDSVKARFWAKVDKRGPDECWEWQGCRGNLGYGLLGVTLARGVWKNIRTHRLSLMLRDGIAPQSDIVVRHKCDNPPCCNPNHLEWGTQRQNMQDAYDRGLLIGGPRKTHCKRGHVLADENVRVGSDGNRNGCRICNKILSREYYLRDKEQGRVRPLEKKPMKSHCRRGHPLTPDSIYYRGTGHRGHCKQCNAINNAAATQRRREARLASMAAAGLELV